MYSILIRAIVPLIVLIGAWGATGVALGTSGQALVTGSNNAGTLDTSLTTDSTGYGWLVQQTGTGFGIKSTTGSTGNTALYGSTTNKASYGLNALNTTAGGIGLHAAGSTAARFDGNVVVNGTCSGCDSRQGFTRTRIDSPGVVGEYSSIAIGTDGLPLISYFDATNFHLKVAHCNNQACTAATLTTLDSSGSVGKYTSITIGSDGLGLISYQDYNSGLPTLKVAHCSNVACTTATKTTVDGSSGIYVGFWTSIAIGTDGLGVIAHANFGPTPGLVVTHCSNVACTSATSKQIYNGDDESISMSVEGNGDPVISYHNASTADLRIVDCLTTACDGNNTATISSSDDWGLSSSVATGPDGFPYFAFVATGNNAGIGMGRCADESCNGANAQIGGLGDSGGAAVALTMEPNGIPVAAVWDSVAGSLDFMRCLDETCTNESRAILLDNTAGTGSYSFSYMGSPSMTIGSDGYPIISYYDLTNSALKVLHCSNPFCVPYFRPR